VANNSGFLSGIGGTIAVLTTGNLAAGSINALVNNTFGGSIGSGGNLGFNVGGTLSVGRAANFIIDNHSNGSIGSEVLLGINANSISAGDTFTARIDNSEGGSITGNAEIHFGAAQATFATDANVEILGSDGAGSAAINVASGNYNANGTFRTYIDGSGTIALNNATMHADVLKVGALGADGVLNIGGGTLSADTTLKLYASGSNGQLNFTSDVSLNGNSTKILAANSVTIFDDVTVTIGGDNAANVYTNNPNYTGFGGNGSTSGTFSGAGANEPLSLDQAPAFDSEGARPPSNTAQQTQHSGSSTPRVTKKGRTTVVIADSGQLQTLLDRPESGVAAPTKNEMADRTPGSDRGRRNNGADRTSATRAADTNTRMSAIQARSF
jgi:hypothetical protein